MKLYYDDAEENSGLLLAMSEQTIVSPVWRMKGLTVDAYLLQLIEDRVVLADGSGVLFDKAVSEIQAVKWPMLQFGYGFEAIVDGEKYKITFMKPNGAPTLDPGLFGGILAFTEIGRGLDAVKTLAKAGESKENAKKFRAVLGG